MHNAQSAFEAGALRGKILMKMGFEAGRVACDEDFFVFMVMVFYI